jgi:hypothetical protein
VQAVFARYPDGILDPAGERWLRVLERELVASLPPEADDTLAARRRVEEVLKWYPSKALAAAPAALLESLEQQLGSALDWYAVTSAGPVADEVNTAPDAGEGVTLPRGAPLPVGAPDAGSPRGAQGAAALAEPREPENASDGRAVPTDDPAAAEMDDADDPPPTEPTATPLPPVPWTSPGIADEADVAELIRGVVSSTRPIMPAPAPPACVPPAAVGEPRTAVDEQIDRGFAALVLTRRPEPATAPAAAPPRPDESASCPAAPAASSSTASRRTADATSSRK